MCVRAYAYDKIREFARFIFSSLHYFCVDVIVYCWYMYIRVLLFSLSVLCLLRFSISLHFRLTTLEEEPAFLCRNVMLKISLQYIGKLRFSIWFGGGGWGVGRCISDSKVFPNFTSAALLLHVVTPHNYGVERASSCSLFASM